MGGTTSKFNDTDWTVADGKLRSSTETVDGAVPVDDYATFYMTKKSVYQRDFEVTDNENNLLYSTRSVPGTIACFDVMRYIRSGDKLGEQHVLRINVDLPRRNWVLYRPGVPVFEGQMSDKEATQKYRLDLSDEKNTIPFEGEVESVDTELYKVCCITVSWSRYMAVAVRYKEPTVEELTEYQGNSKNRSDQNEDTEASDDDMFNQATQIAGRMRERENSAEIEKSGSSDWANNVVIDAIESQSPTGAEAVIETESEETKTVKAGPKSEIIAESKTEHETADASNDKDDKPDQPTLKNVDSTSTIRGWIQQQSKNIQDTSQSMKSYIYSSSNITSVPDHPLKGVIDVEKPLLLCQEIFTRIIGNHQTSLLTKQKMLEYLRRDAKSKEDNNIGATEPEEDQIKGVSKLEDEVPGSGIEETKSSEDVNTKEESTKDETIKEQPLVAYWSWENTLRTHKVKFHMAKGTDLALHVVLAVIVNQVRIERHAIAISI